jgi:ATP-dependent Clp protease ATP-binding subunit ClpC
MALREALQLGHNYIGTEHILLGTMRESESDAGVVASVLGVGVDELRGRLLALIGRGTSPGASGSPALVQANRRADELAGGGPVTTGHVLEAMVADPGSQAGKVLQRLGLTAETVQAELSAVDVASTSDAPPAPRRVEIKLGETTMTIEDAEIVAAMEGLTADQLRAVLQKALGGSRKRRAAGSAG